jgi:DNA mismatch repair protein MutS2
MSAQSESPSSSVPLFLHASVADAVTVSAVDTLASLLGIEVKEAEKVVLKANERAAGFTVREMLCTNETREILREIVKLLASYAVTKTGMAMCTTRTPTLDPDALRKRFADVREGIRLHDLLGREQIAAVQELLAQAEITPIRFDSTPVIATQRRGLESQLQERYGDYVRVAVVDSAAKAQALLHEASPILAVADAGERVLDEPGIISIPEDAVADVRIVYPEFVVQSFRAKSTAMAAVVQLVTEFEALKTSALFDTISIADLEAVLALLAGLGDEERAHKVNFADTLLRWEEAINQEASRIAQTGGGAEDFQGYLDEVVMSMADELQLTAEDRDLLWESAYENLERGPPFEFSRVRTMQLQERYARQIAEQRYFRLRDCATRLMPYEEAVNTTLKRLFYLDFLLAVARFSHDFGLTIPEIGTDGLGVIKGRNLFLVDEELKGGETVVPISYSVGSTDLGIFGATPLPVAILTGANSGGKTCLLITLATSMILTGLGLPVPAERAEIPLLPLYLYRRKMIKKTGSFEYSMRALSRIFMREGPKVVLIDELEALTEPGAMGRIMAALLNHLPANTRAVMITHLINELRPHIDMKKVRVDGIESEGLDAAGTIIVDRQPLFNHIGSSTPELVITKLMGRVRKAKLRTVYQEILKALEQERDEWP